MTNFKMPNRRLQRPSNVPPTHRYLPNSKEVIYGYILSTQGRCIPSTVRPVHFQPLNNSGHGTDVFWSGDIPVTYDLRSILDLGSRDDLILVVSSSNVVSSVSALQIGTSSSLQHISDVPLNHKLVYRMLTMRGELRRDCRGRVGNCIGIMIRREKQHQKLSSGTYALNPTLLPSRK